MGKARPEPSDGEEARTLRELFPGWVARSLGAGGDVPVSSEEERALVARAVASRRSEFAAGRRHARIALAQLGIAAAVIGRGRWGEPIWPAGIVGSISHTCDRVGAVVAHGDRAAGIGFDVERLRPETAAVAGSALSDAERQSVARLGPDRRRIAPIVLLSAKEAAFKALFPLVGPELPSFVDLQAVWHPVSRVATVIVPHAPACAPKAVRAHVRVLRAHVLTGVLIERSPPSLH